MFDKLMFSLLVVRVHQVIALTHQLAVTMEIPGSIEIHQVASEPFGFPEDRQMHTLVNPHCGFPHYESQTKGGKEFIH